MNLGFHSGIPAADYHAGKLHEQPALSSSIAAILLRESPRKAWYSHPRLNQSFKEEHDDKFDLGTAAHAVLLEGDESKLVVVEADDWRTNKAKETREIARAAGKTALLAKQKTLVSAMVAAAQTFLMESEIAQDWKNAESEVTALAEDQGVILKARFDRITTDRKVICDYKTTTDAAPEVFSRQLVRMGYHWQDAFYRRVASLLGAKSPVFVFLAQSIEPPYECSLHGCDSALQEIADSDIGRAFDKWRICITTNKWPSYGGRVHWAMPTTWQINDYETRLREAA